MLPEIPLLFVDERLLVINKPAGLPTLPDGYDKAAPHVKSVLEPQYGRLWIVHRLDKDTSGVLVLARDAAAHQVLNTQFDGRLVTKVYHALVEGVPNWESTTLNVRLKPNGDRRHRTIPHPAGKPAITHLRVLEHLGDYALIEATPETGRTHQIRAHLGFAGFPLIADELYGGHPSPLLTRYALHACSIRLTHPAGQALKIEAPYPADFSTALAQLRSSTTR